MTYRLIATYEPTGISAGKAASAELDAWFSSPAHQDIARKPGLTSFDVMVPETGKVRFFDDGPTPVAIVHFTAEAPGMLADIARSDPFRDGFWHAPQKLAEVSPDFGLYEMIAAQIGDAPDPQNRKAALSFVVRYFEPIAEAERFCDIYIANHPPILARFPDVRNVFCYLPIDIELGDLPASKVALGNEVVFDDLAALNTALSSSVLADLREDSKNFPRFGRSSHHAMIRRRHFTP
jgi:hypothetical protein